MFGLGIRFWLIIIVISVISAGLLHYRYTLAENARLKTELHTANATVTALDETARQNNELHERERNTVNDIESAPDSDDGPIAPVLLRTINRM